MRTEMFSKLTSIFFDEPRLSLRRGVKWGSNASNGDVRGSDGISNVIGGGGSGRGAGDFLQLTFPQKKARCHPKN